MFLASTAFAFLCASPAVHDGDSIRCAGRREALRLADIDAPEMAGSPACDDRRRKRKDCDHAAAVASRDALRTLLASGAVTCSGEIFDRYGRRLVRCRVGSTDVASWMIRRGHARRW